MTELCHCLAYRGYKRMKNHTRRLFQWPALIAVLSFFLAGPLTAQTFSVLYNFTARSGPNNINSDGAGTFGGLLLSGSTLYGTTQEGGSSGNGTVFSVNADGTGFTTLHSFVAGSDGGLPWGALILSGGVLYGTTSQGGGSGEGTVFSVNNDGTGFTIIHSFTPRFNSTNSDGAFPRDRLVLSGNSLYGTTYNGGLGAGTVFSVNTNGTVFTTLHSFYG